jgi:signal transduction histidine kinase
MNWSKITSGIGTKLAILFSSFAFILLAVVLAHQYISIKDHILNESDRRLTRSKEILAKAYSDGLKEYFSEISALQFRLLYYGENEIFNRREVESFLYSYSNRYNKLLFYSAADSLAYSATPQKLFTGAYNIQFEVFSRSDIDNIPGQDTLLTNGNSIIIYNYFEGTKEQLIIAEIDLSNKLNSLISHLVLPHSIGITIINNSNTIIFTSDKTKLNLHISNLFNVDLDDDYNNLNNTISYQSSRLYFYRLANPILNVIIEDNLEKEYEQLNLLLFRLSVFSVFLFIVILVIIRIVVRKVSQKLHVIKDVTDRVGDGDLNTSIEIESNDELGVLISAFNKMVMKLKGNYEELNNVNKELIDKIEELVETKSQLSEAQRLAVIGETISKISHEIQNKIGAVSLWVQNLEYSLNDNGTNEVYIKEIKNSLNEFLQMLANFKRFYRKPALHITNVNINILCKEIISRSQKQLEQKSITVITKLNEKVNIVEVDEKLIDEVISNLFINGIEACPNNGSIILESYLEQDYFCFLIHDSGKGINPEVRINIFSPFVTTKPQGSGLGLAISKNIVNAHNGKISTCKSELNGACFKVSLPHNQNK